MCATPPSMRPATSRAPDPSRSTELADRLDELPADVDIVAYCRGTYCVYADDAVRELTGNGRRARRLEGGFPEWRADNRPVDRGDEEPA